MEDPFINLIITATVTSLIASLMGYIFWLKKRERTSKDRLEEEIDSVQQQIKVLQSRADNLEKRLLEEQEIRKIAQEENSGLREELLELKASILKLTELMSELRIDLGVLNYIKDRDRKKES